MKTILQRNEFKLMSVLASAAFVLAMSSVSSTCGFMLYQPDVPEELQ